jgi:hypothetical protein
MTDLDIFRCKKCGQTVSYDDLLEHIVLVHNDRLAAKLVNELNSLANLNMVGGTNN